jgi:hypothetical protein
MLLGYVPYFNKACCAFVGNVPPLTCVRVGPSARVLSPLSALSERARDFFCACDYSGRASVTMLWDMYM